VDETVDRGGNLLLHIVGKELMGKAFGVEQLLADSITDGGGDVAFFLGDDAGGEWNSKLTYIVGLIGPEKHGDGQPIGEATNDCTYGRTYENRY
jgi:hypothetical protein